MPASLITARHFVYGACSGCGSKSELANVLSHHGLGSHERAHSISVSECECLSFEFDQSTENEASIEGTAATAEVLRANAYQIHQILLQAGVRHWLEVTTDVQSRLEYFHHQWPEET